MTEMKAEAVAAFPGMNLLIRWVERRYPGSKVIIDFALEHIDDLEKMWNLILEAVAMYQSGASFIDILKMLLAPELPANITFPDV